MAKKTVINRACKIAIKSSDDSSLALIKDTMKSNDKELTEAIVEAEIEENANQELIDIDDTIEAEYTEVKEETPEEKETEQVTMDGEPYWSW